MLSAKKNYNYHNLSYLLKRIIWLLCKFYDNKHWSRHELERIRVSDSICFHSFRISSFEKQFRSSILKFVHSDCKRWVLTMDSHLYSPRDVNEPPCMENAPLLTRKRPLAIILRLSKLRLWAHPCVIVYLPDLLSVGLVSLGAYSEILLTWC